MDFKQRMAIIKKYEQKLIQYNPELANARISGIYFLVRKDENGFKYAYIGQSKNILRRLAEHLNGYEQHIDKSLKAHGLYSNDNIDGWSINYIYYNDMDLDEKEKYWTKQYADAGYQLRNKTGGGQGVGKYGINENKPAKGYYEGLKQGYKNAQKEVAKLFTYLEFTIKGKSTKTKERMLEKFKNFLEI